MTVGFELPYTPGDAAGFIDQLWANASAYPDGMLVGVIHLVGDRGQILIRVDDPRVQQLVVLPGQILVAESGDPHAWSVVDGHHSHLRLHH